EAVGSRGERAELAREGRDRGLGRLDAPDLEGEEVDRPVFELDELVDDRVGVDAGREAADGDHARHAAPARLRDEERAGDREIPGPERTDRCTRAFSAGAGGRAPGAGWPGR